MTDVGADFGLKLGYQARTTQDSVRVGLRAEPKAVAARLSVQVDAPKHGWTSGRINRRLRHFGRSPHQNPRRKTLFASPCSTALGSRSLRLACPFVRGSTERKPGLHRLSAGGRWIRTIGTAYETNLLATPFGPRNFAFRNKNRLFRARDRWFESISLQQRVQERTCLVVHIARTASYRLPRRGIRIPALR